MWEGTAPTKDWLRPTQNVLAGTVFRNQKRVPVQHHIHVRVELFLAKGLKSGIPIDLILSLTGTLEECSLSLIAINMGS